ncbi:MgtC/SapB family protein [Pelagibacterium halotolerans]|uniref:Protein MgtC n=1 Tax=Pelagibacterium halotolerans (strain DSM 22347 / JCM 15775 / CGMCC 1.7692 / B2) TaxID=1082931 RepID=G4RA93_PELHB|nr:MgtC/SapB family protein [Pelagibacterium halotolerans]AEQ50452.1 MgtC/SapB transporter [Pelagibacterium halotolerans B2]QJR19584.1 MgtC/SapB family protein [Pelagibacterium halotolerans]SDZ87363.1 putative Mg2+ transporter-C (MgtC) family protein [Pelagibacterium halotolerans]
MEDFLALGGNPTHESFIVLAARLLIAAVLGALIGLEREISRHPAGLRTHMLVSTAAAAFTVMTFEIYHEMVDLNAETIARLDPIRVIEAVTAGVAFLAAGAIIRSGTDIKGLTTGAGLWMAGAIGVAAGSGFFSVAVTATVLVLIITVVLGQFEKRFLDGEDDR